ncbi:MAG: XdhC family protein, partial [Myxococcota bacterium]|nr:XdhC family protein [Myxococcota bacterium]
MRVAGERAVLVTVVGASGSTPRKLGARMLVLADGQIEGTIGGGRVEEAVRAEALEVLASGQSVVRRYELTHELAMCCGGKMSFLMEPVGPEATLIVMGCGHVGRAIIQAASAVDFRIYAVDDLATNLMQLQDLPVSETLDSFDRHSIDALPFG